MPVSSARLCSKHGCSQLGSHSHQDARPSAARRGYGRTWQRLRVLHLHVEPLCRECAKHGGLTRATDVDHITPKQRGGRDVDENLQSLCHAHHSEKTARENGGFGRQDWGKLQTVG